MVESKIIYFRKILTCTMKNLRKYRNLRWHYIADTRFPHSLTDKIDIVKNDYGWKQSIDLMQYFKIPMLFFSEWAKLGLWTEVHWVDGQCCSQRTWIISTNFSDRHGILPYWIRRPHRQYNKTWLLFDSYHWMLWPYFWRHHLLWK